MCVQVRDKYVADLLTNYIAFSAFCIVIRLSSWFSLQFYISCAYSRSDEDRRLVSGPFFLCFFDLPEFASEFSIFSCQTTCRPVNTLQMISKVFKIAAKLMYIVSGMDWDLHRSVYEQRTISTQRL